MCGFIWAFVRSSQTMPAAPSLYSFLIIWVLRLKVCEARTLIQHTGNYGYSWKLCSWCSIQHKARQCVLWFIIYRHSCQPHARKGTWQATTKHSPSSAASLFVDSCAFSNLPSVSGLPFSSHELLDAWKTSKPSSSNQMLNQQKLVDSFAIFVLVNGIHLSCSGLVCSHIGCFGHCYGSDSIYALPPSGSWLSVKDDNEVDTLDLYITRRALERQTHVQQKI